MFETIILGVPAILLVALAVSELHQKRKFDSWRATENLKWLDERQAHRAWVKEADEFLAKERAFLASIK
jgi:spore coat polysaccharide biosynthesis predicted glycosyltransferase SpsG